MSTSPIWLYDKLRKRRIFLIKYLLTTTLVEQTLAKSMGLLSFLHGRPSPPLPIPFVKSNLCQPHFYYKKIGDLKIVLDLIYLNLGEGLANHYQSSLSCWKNFKAKIQNSDQPKGWSHKKTCWF